MDIILWILQILLAVAFGVSGAMKAFSPEERLLSSEQMAWIQDTGLQRARIAGFAELTAAAGLILLGLL